MVTPPAGPCRVLDCRLRSGEHRIDGGIVDGGETFDVVGVFDLAFRIVSDPAPDAIGWRRLVHVSRRDLRGFSQRPNTVGRQRPVRKLGSDPPTGT